MDPNVDKTPRRRFLAVSPITPGRQTARRVLSMRSALAFLTQYSHSAVNRGHGRYGKTPTRPPGKPLILGLGKPLRTSGQQSAVSQTREEPASAWLLAEC